MRFAIHGWPALLVAAGAVVLSGCGGGSSPSVVRSGGLTASPSAGSPSAGSPSAGSPSSSGTAPAGSPGGTGGPSVTISPSTGLRSGMTVHVTAVGFTPGQPLVINECADKGSNTGPADCNLPGMVATAADTSGRVSADYVVTAGPFGANNIVCSAAQPCLLSVSQAVPSPSEEADVRLRFD